MKWSEIDEDTQDYRDGFVGVYLLHKGEPLEDENGEPLKLKNGRRATVTQEAFAEHYGIGASTFKRWLSERGETAPVGPYHPSSKEILARNEPKTPVPGPEAEFPKKKDPVTHAMEGFFDTINFVDVDLGLNKLVELKGRSPETFEREEVLKVVRDWKTKIDYILGDSIAEGAEQFLREGEASV